MPSKTEMAEKQLEEFALQFGSNGFVETTIVKVCDGIFAVAEAIFGSEQADAGMVEMLRATLGDEVDDGWHEALVGQMMGLYSETPIGEVFHNLEAYALYGVFPGYAEGRGAREENVKTCLQACEHFMTNVPFEAWGIENEHAYTIFEKSKARWKLDQGEALSIDELSLLSGYAKQTIRNRMAGVYKELVGSAKSIQADEALAWLSTKKKFRPSLWQYQDDSGFGEIIEEHRLKSPVFVPVASDGDCFSESTLKDGFYWVGDGSAGLQFTDFEQALRVLHSASNPMWLRPLKSGAWGRVRGVGWQRIDRSAKESPEA